jgi:hypothetical protein
LASVNNVYLSDFVPPGPFWDDITRRRRRRHRVAFNHGVRRWLLALGREGRRQLRLDPPCDDSELPF